MARMPDRVETGKSEPMQVLRDFREKAIRAEGWLMQSAFKVLGYALIGVGILILAALAVIAIAVLIPLIVAAVIVIGVAVIVSAIVDAIVDVFNSVWNAIKESTSKRRAEDSD